jgi:hypothetical protein
MDPLSPSVCVDTAILPSAEASVENQPISQGGLEGAKET